MVARNSRNTLVFTRVESFPKALGVKAVGAASKLHATNMAPAESNTRRKGKRSEVMTAMKERFSTTELTALRNDLLQGGMIDSREAAELLQVFLMGRGYGVSPQAALDAAFRVESAGCSMPILQQELENLALVM
jgi:hypothetical protein